jgi:Tfp pilus assembly protein PilP
VIGAVFIALSSWFFFSTDDEGVNDPRRAIQQAVSNIKDPIKRQHRAISLAINQYRSKRGRLPNRLEELVPKWFDKVPLNPVTRKPFTYKIIANKPILGEEEVDEETENDDFSNLSKDEVDMLIASFDGKDSDSDYKYSSIGKRDPFSPFDFTVKVSVDTTVPPLQRYSVGQLKLSAILRGDKEASAMVETEEGMGYPVRVGTRIGIDNGIVTEILSDKVKITESVTDFTGAVKSREVEMHLRRGDTDTFSRPKVTTRARPHPNSKRSGR